MGMSNEEIYANLQRVALAKGITIEQLCEKLIDGEKYRDETMAGVLAICKDPTVTDKNRAVVDYVKMRNRDL